MYSRLFFLSLLAILMGCADAGPASSTATKTLFALEVTGGVADGFGPTLVQTEVPRKYPRFHLVSPAGVDMPVNLTRKDQLTNVASFFLDIDPGEQMTFYAVSGELEAEQNGLDTQFSIGGEPITLWTLADGALDHGGVLIANEDLGFRITNVGRHQLQIFDLPTRDIATLTEEDIVANLLVVAPESAGVGGLGLYNYDGIVKLDSPAEKEIRIAEVGGFHSKVEVVLRGIQVRDELLDLQIDYVFYAEKPFVDIKMRLLSKTDLNLKFAIGLPRHEEATGLIQGVKGKTHFSYTFGTQSTGGMYVGAGLMIKDPFVTEIFNDDPENHMYLVDPMDNTVQFRALCLYSADHSAISDEMEFIDWLRTFALSYDQSAGVRLLAED